MSELGWSGGLNRVVQPPSAVRDRSDQVEARATSNYCHLNYPLWPHQTLMLKTYVGTFSLLLFLHMHIMTWLGHISDVIRPMWLEWIVTIVQCSSGFNLAVMGDESDRVYMPPSKAIVPAASQQHSHVVFALYHTKLLWLWCWCSKLHSMWLRCFCDGGTLSNISSFNMLHLGETIILGIHQFLMWPRLSIQKDHHKWSCWELAHLIIILPSSPCAP